jgi:hypothetical protein
MLLDTTHGFAYRDVRDGVRILFGKSRLASGSVYSVTVNRTDDHTARLVLEEEGRVLCDTEVKDLKSCRSCYFGVFQNNGGALSARNVRVGNVLQIQGAAGASVTRLCRCFPNPFAGGTAIQYEIGRRNLVRLRVFDSRGRLVAVIERAMKDVGCYEAYWDGVDHWGRRVASGVYFCVLETPGSNQGMKLVLLR